MTYMSMPKMTGGQIAQLMHTIRPDLPIVICTGYSDKMSADKAQAMGIKGYLMKPIVTTELAQLVRKVLDEAKGLSLTC